jgi:hypothetical protein
MGALAHLEIARAYAMQGDTAKAKATYQDFLTLWKDAAPHPERSQGGIRKIAVIALRQSRAGWPMQFPAIDLVFNVKVNLGCGAVSGNLLAVQLHF